MDLLDPVVRRVGLVVLRCCWFVKGGGRAPIELRAPARGDLLATVRLEQGHWVGHTPDGQAITDPMRTRDDACRIVEQALREVCRELNAAAYTAAQAAHAGSPP